MAYMSAESAITFTITVIWHANLQQTIVGALGGVQSEAAQLTSDTDSYIQDWPFKKFQIHLRKAHLLLLIASSWGDPWIHQWATVSSKDRRGW